MKLVVKILIKEGKVGEFVEKCRELVAETRKESGCISYELCQDRKNENLLAFMEEWESMEAIQLHKSLPHFKKMSPVFGEFIETSYPAEKYNTLL